MPKLVIEHPISHKIQTYLIVCDDDIPKIVKGSQNVIAVPWSNVVKAAYSAKSLPLNEMESYQQLLIELDELQDKLHLKEHELDSIKRKSSNLETQFQFVLTQLTNYSIWTRFKMIWSGYKQFRKEIY